MLLAAEVRNDHNASYVLVVHDGAVPSSAKWTRIRRDLPAITGFTVEADRDPSVATAMVQHQPGLNSFVGLVPAHERQTWKARRTASGWLLEPFPEVRPVLAPEAGAAGVAMAWLRAVQRCDRAGTAALQAVPTLFDSTTNDIRLCRTAGELRVRNGVDRMPPGPLSGDIVAQYSTDAFTWARVVHVDAPVRLTIVLAPIGNDWKVLGLADPF